MIISAGRVGTQLIWRSLSDAGYKTGGEVINEWNPNMMFRDLIKKYGITNQGFINEQVKLLENSQYISDCYEQCDLISTLYHHINDDILNWLLTNSIKIIHLKRSNKLLRYLSVKHARTSKVWKSEQSISINPIYIDVQSFLEECDYTQEQENKYNDIGLQLYYEETIDWDTFINKIFDYVGEPRKKIPQSIVKLLDIHPRSVIINFNELSRHERIQEYISMCDPFFTADWFSHAIPMFEKHLSCYMDKKCRFLEIGAYEGRSTYWVINNILKHNEGVIDVVEPGYSGRNDTLKQNLRRYIENGKVNLIQENSTRLSQYQFGPYDFVYVDGSHNKDIVIQDCINGFNYLKPGGIMAMDDYLWPESSDPKLAIDCFLQCFHGKCTILEKGYQVWVQKL